MEDTCIYSSATRTSQKLHNSPLWNQISDGYNISDSKFIWGKWLFYFKNNSFLLFNCENPTQVQVLAKIQSGFIFYPAKSTTRNHGPYYYPQSLETYIKNTLK